MPSRGFRMVGILPVFGLAAAPVHPPFCFIDHVVQNGHGIELDFVPGSNVFVRISKEGQGVAVTDRIYQQQGDQMHRSRANAQRLDAAVSKVVLFPGEEASLGNNPHSACVIRPAVEGNLVGVTMKSSVSMGGLPPAIATRFLPVGTRQGADH